MRDALRSAVLRARGLWERAKAEATTPRELAWSVGLGVFVGCTPLLGLHMWIALGLATLFRLNRLWAFLGSRVSLSGVFVWIAFAEIQAGSWLRTGHGVPLSPREALARGPLVLVDWSLGTVPVGLALALPFAALAYAWRRKQQQLTPDRPDAPLEPTSGSPP